MFLGVFLNFLGGERVLVEGFFRGYLKIIIAGGRVGSSGNLEDLEIFDIHGGQKSWADPNTLYMKKMRIFLTIPKMPSSAKTKPDRSRYR